MMLRGSEKVGLFAVVYVATWALVAVPVRPGGLRLGARQGLKEFMGQEAKKAPERGQEQGNEFTIQSTT